MTTEERMKQRGLLWQEVRRIVGDFNATDASKNWATDQIVRYINDCCEVKAKADVIYLMSMVQKQRDALENFVNEYERADRKGYDPIISYDMNEVAKQALKCDEGGGTQCS